MLNEGFHYERSIWEVDLTVPKEGGSPKVIPCTRTRNGWCLAEFKLHTGSSADCRRIYQHLPMDVCASRRIVGAPATDQVDKGVNWLINGRVRMLVTGSGGAVAFASKERVTRVARAGVLNLIYLSTPHTFGFKASISLSAVRMTGILI